MRILDFAIDFERTGSSYFRYLAEKTTHPEASAVFRMMADDEEELARRFQSLRDQSEGLRKAESPFLDENLNFFARMSDTQDAFAISDNIDAYRYVMRVESEICRFYEEAASREPCAETRQLLRRLAREERKELDSLGRIYEFINAPNAYLAWGEFSNLGEFHNFGRTEG